MKFFKGCEDGVHKYRGRYDQSEIKLPGNLRNIKMSEAGMEKFRAVTYVRDVCVRCGDVIERNSEVVPIKRQA